MHDDDDMFGGDSDVYSVDGLQVESFETAFNMRSSSDSSPLDDLDEQVNRFLDEHEIYDVQVDVDVGERRYKGFKSYTIFYREEDSDG